MTEDHRSYDDSAASPDAAPDELVQADTAIREEAPGGRPGSGFDPTPYLRQLRGRGGGQEYLDVRWCLVWLRRDHPDAEIVTEHVQIDATIAIFKATVTLPTGGKATGYGSETAGDFGDYIEKAETKAIGRALRALGYGAQFSERGDEPELAAVPATTPRSAPATPASPAAASRPRPVAAERPQSPVPAERPGPRPVPDAAAARPRAAAPSPSRQAQGAASARRPAGEPDDAELADYSWSAFWPWARELGLADKKAIEQLIGRSTDGLLPADLRAMIVAAQSQR